MARYNTIASTSTSNGAQTITSPSTGLLTTLTGTAPYTTTIPNPILYTGQQQSFYNATGGVVTLATPSGNFTGAGASGSANQTVAAGAIITIISDGANYVVQSFPGGSQTASSLTLNGALTANPTNANISLQPTGTGSVTINPGTTGSIANMTGSFTTLSANGATTLTATTIATAYNTGALQVSGGVGIAGAVFTNSTLTTSGGITVSSGGITVSSGGLSVTGTGSISGITSITNATAVTLGTAASGALQVTGGVGVGGGVYVAGTSSFGGNVGIGTGTNSTTAPLSLSGTSRSSLITFGTGGSAGTAGIAVADGLSGNTDGRLLFGNGGSSYAALRMVFNSTTGTQIDSVTWGSSASETNLNFQSNGGNVGIGTNSPGTTLDVAGTIRSTVSSGNNIVLEKATGGFLAFTQGGTLYGGIQSINASNGLQFYQGSNEAMRINSSGYVGIGTTSPTYPLVVNGATVASQFLPSGNPSIFSSVSAMGFSGVINWWSNAGDAGSNSPGNVSYLPYIHWTNLQASYGYRQHTVLGSYRDGGADWGSAMIAVGGNDSYPTVAFTFDYVGNSHTPGTVYGGAKSFKIPHPHPDKEDTHNLVYASIESPSLDLLFRGEVTLVDGEATVNLDTVCKQTEGTFVNLCRQVQCFTTNESDWTAVKGRVDGNMLNIVTQDSKSTATISWMVIGQRKDKLAMALDLTDDNGELITEIIPRHVDKSNHAEILNPGQDESDLSTMMKNTPDQK